MTVPTAYKVKKKTMSQNDKPKAKSTKRIIDVAHPGKTAPSATSRPVIVTNRPILKDPMMADNTAEEPDTSTAPKTGKAKLEPLQEPSDVSDKKTPEEMADEPAEAASSPKTKEPAETDDDQPSTENDETEETDDESVAQPSDDEESKDVAEQTAEEIDASEIEAQAKHDAAIEKLVDSKQYFLPINSVEKRRTKRFAIVALLLVIIVVVVWIDIALDAGLIKLGGVQPVTDFFKN